MPTGILATISYDVNNKANICKVSIPQDITINDLLENIRILVKFIISRKITKNTLFAKKVCVRMFLVTEKCAKEKSEW